MGDDCFENETRHQRKAQPILAPLPLVLHSVSKWNEPERELLSNLTSFFSRSQSEMRGSFYFKKQTSGVYKQMFMYSGCEVGFKSVRKVKCTNYF